MKTLPKDNWGMELSGKLSSIVVRSIVLFSEWGVKFFDKNRRGAKQLNNL